MKPYPIILALTALLGTACSSGGSDSSASAPKTATLSLDECRQVVEKSMQLQGMPREMFAEIATQAANECHTSGKATKTDLQCAMAATSIEQFRACNIDVMS